MKTLKNVIDKRTGNLHSVAIVNDQNEKYFVAAEQPTEQPKKAKTKKKKG